MAILFAMVLLPAPAGPSIATEIYFILRAGGDTKATLLMDSCFMWLINIPLIAALAYLTDLKIYFVYIAGQLTDLVKMGIASYFFKRERWVKNLTVVEE